MTNKSISRQDPRSPSQRFSQSGNNGTEVVRAQLFMNMLTFVSPRKSKEAAGKIQDTAVSTGPAVAPSAEKHKNNHFVNTQDKRYSSHTSGSKTPPRGLQRETLKKTRPPILSNPRLQRTNIQRNPAGSTTASNHTNVSPTKPTSPNLSKIFPSTLHLPLKYRWS
jgi:hypothetical protein